MFYLPLVPGHESSPVDEGAEDLIAISASSSPPPPPLLLLLLFLLLLMLLLLVAVSFADPFLIWLASLCSPMVGMLLMVLFR